MSVTPMDTALPKGPPMSLATRIFLGYAVVLLTFGAVSIVSVLQLHENQLELRLLSAGYMQLSHELAWLASLNDGRQNATTRVWLERSAPQTRRDLIHLLELYYPELIARRLHEAAGRTTEAEEFAPASERAFLTDLRARLRELGERNRVYEAGSRALFRRLSEARPEFEALAPDMEALRQAEASLGRSIKQLDGLLKQRISERVTGAERRERRTGLTIIGLSVVAIAIGLLATAVSARALRPVRTLIEGVGRIQKGDFGAQLNIRGADEISLLAQQFDALASSLKQRDEELALKQTQLLHAERLAAVGRMAAQIAHEVRNPLSSIGLNVEMLQEHFERTPPASPADAEEASHLFRAITREVDRLTEITEQYLKLARRPAPALADESPDELVAGVLDFSAEELTRAGVEVRRELGAGAARVTTDEGQLRQVLLNLVRNSREAMPQGGTLVARTRALADRVEIELSDTGAGMTEDVQRRIFEPFFSTKPGGTGMGLSLSQQIIEAQGGTIRCESAPGTGARFVISLRRA